MAFDSSITLDGTAGADHIFLLQSSLGAESLRVLSTATLSEPFTLALKASQSGNKAAGIMDRYLISLAEVHLDTANVDQRLISNFTLSASRSTVITRAMINNQLALIADIIGDSTMVDKVLRKEV